jgi:hypothetical protein
VVEPPQDHPSTPMAFSFFGWAGFAQKVENST